MINLDIHTHILPGVDDGSQNIEESIALLNQEKENGVDAVVLTPHFYPTFHTFEEHVLKTQNAFKQLKEATSSLELPEIFLGHEVQYFSGISKSQSLDLLCISNTNYLLLELPFLSSLTTSMLDEIIKIDRDLGIIVIIAHIERYANSKLFKKLLKLVEEGNALAQLSADFNTNKSTAKIGKKLLKKGIISFIASDAHNINERPVSLKNAYELLHRDFYPQYIHCIKKSEALYYAMKGTDNG